MNSTAEELNNYEEEQVFRPPLKWAGGKRWLISQLHPLYATYKCKRLVEPFVGGLAVALGLNPKKALLNDTNPHLINFYNHLKNGLVITADMKNEREFFFDRREKFNELIENGQSNSKESADLFYYMNRTAFNGLCRFNSSGKFNVPFGKYSKINYITDFTHYMGILKGWDFVCGDFENLHVKSDDFLYIDPPYDVEFTRYSKDDFTWNDQVRLVEWLNQFSCPIVASNQATERIIDLYKRAGFTVNIISAPRKISCNGNREDALEILACKNIIKNNH